MISATDNFIAANANQVKVPIFALEIEDYARIFTSRDTGIVGHYPWIVEIADHSLTVDDLEGSSELGDLAVTVLDFQRLITADMVATIFEGRIVTLKVGLDGLAYEDFCTLYTGKIHDVPASDDNNCWVFTAKDKRIDLQQPIWQTGDDGEATSSEHPKTLNGHPLDLLETALDQCGMTTDDYDQDTLHAYRDEIFVGMNFEFNLTTAPEAKEFIEKQILKVLGGYQWCDSAGKLRFTFFVPLPASLPDPVEITPDNSQLPQLSFSDLQNVVTVRMDKSDDSGTSSGGFLTEHVEPDTDSITKFNQQGQVIIESDGLRSAFQGVAIAQQTAAAIFARYGNKNPQFDPVVCFWELCRLEPGDAVSVTNPLVPDRDNGVMGIENKIMQVLNRVWQFGPCLVQYKLIDGSALTTGGGFSGSAFKIAPNSEADWTAASDADKAKYMFIAGTDGRYSDGVHGNKLA
jgi:hypothetical protein